jgi:hypothetical protein
MCNGQIWESNFSILYALDKVYDKSLILTDRLTFKMIEKECTGLGESLESSTKHWLVSAGKFTITLQPVVIARNC